MSRSAGRPRHGKSAYDSTFHERLVDEYAGQRNFYALAYDQDEVIDAVRFFVGLAWSPRLINRA